MPCCRDGRLDNEHISAGVDGERGEFLGVGWRTGDGANAAAFLDLSNPLTYQIFADRSSGQTLNHSRGLFLAGVDYFHDGCIGVIMPALQAFQVHDHEGATLTGFDGESGVNHRIKGGNGHGVLESQVTYTEADIGKFGIDRDATGNDRDLVKPVRGPQLSHPNG